MVHPINSTGFEKDHLQQNNLFKHSLKYSVISVVHHRPVRMRKVEEKMREVVILGVAMTRFGKFLDKSLKDLAREVVLSVFHDAGISKEQLEAAYVGNASAGLITGQYGIVGQVVLRPLGIGDISVINTENACATGCSAGRTRSSTRAA